MHPQLTMNIDVALLVFWGFVLFFVGLVIYLRGEDRREGYPVEEQDGRIRAHVGMRDHAKTFRLPFDLGTVTTPTKGREPVDLPARRERFFGAPLVPTGDPLADGIGPAAFAERARRPDLDMEGHPRIVPLSSDGRFTVARGDPDLLGFSVIAADGRIAGKVSDLWIDRADRLVRYLQVALDGGRSVPAPMTMAKVDRRRRAVVIDAITAAQFAGAPAPQGDGVITLYEEERVQAYFGGGYLYATPARAEPIL